MADEVIQFWFEELSPKDWWVKDQKLDSLIRDRFLTVHRQARSGELFNWRKAALGRLAEVIVLDQFSRNMFRDTKDAFANDGMALILVQEAVSQKAHLELPPSKRAFLYMPYMHSESRIIHEEAVRRFGEAGMENQLEFEYRHKKIIDQFGRYPHRNKVLGRESTPEEIEFLTQPGSSF